MDMGEHLVQELGSVGQLGESIHLRQIFGVLLARSMSEAEQGLGRHSPH